MKKLKKYLYLFSFLFLFFIPKAHARIIIPALPFDETETNYVMSYWGSDVNRMYLTYCKGSDQRITLRQSVPSGYAGAAIGYCYGPNGEYYGYAYRKSIYAPLTKEQINNYDFEITGEWGSEQYGSSYNTPLNFNPDISKIATWRDYGNYFIEGQPSTYDEVVISGNTDIYDIDYTTIVLSQEDYGNEGISEPTYEVQQTIMDNGNVKLNFTFENYNENGNYGFTISNEVSGEEYGITNPFGNIFPNIIPFQNSYEIEVPYDTYIYITLAIYTQVEETELYTREELYTEVIDINNTTFNNVEDPYFTISSQTKNNIKGEYRNTKNGYSCYFKDSNSNIINVISCQNEKVNHNFSFNGYIEFWIENSREEKIYSRKINVLGENDSMPYIVYNTTKQDFYSVVNWHIENEDYDSNMKYRFSINNGDNWSSWESISNIRPINVFDNATIIIEIADSQTNTIYDTKAINVINSLNEIKTFNSGTNNFLNKFKNLFSVNGKILENVNNYWNIIKTSKIYLLIFIPFITMIISGIIYMIRRK